MLSGVDTEPCDTCDYELIHVVSNPFSYPVCTALQVSQTDEATVPHLNCVVVILYLIHRCCSLIIQTKARFPLPEFTARELG